MTRLNLALALVAIGAPIGAADAATYSAFPATTIGSSRVIGRDIVWTCGPDSCAGASDTSRPVVLCESLARQTGRIDRFDVNGTALGAADLATCNHVAKAARPGAEAALAHAN